MTNADIIWNFLKSKGFNNYAIAGLMGNLKAESALNPMNLQNSYEKKLGMTDDEYVKKVDNGTYKNFSSDAAGFGLAQWTSGGRKKNLYNFIKERNKSIGDLNCQLEFLYKELSENYKTVFNTLKSATSVREASDVVLLKFEIPANRGEEVQKLRASYGQAFYDTYANSNSSSTTTQTTTVQTEVKKEVTGMKFSNYDKYINSTGTHYISNSGSDERKKYTGGSAGDQTGHEWELKAWYNRPWSVVLRYEKDPRVGILAAYLGCAAALNDKIGYDQYQRTTYWTQLQKANYDPSAITTACEEDCTAGVTATNKAVGYILGIEGLKNLSTSIYSGNMKSNFVKAGYTALTDSKYLSSAKYLKPGDVLLYEGHHAATNVTIGSAIKGSYNIPNLTGITVPPTGTAPAYKEPAKEETKPTIAITITGEIIGTATAKQDMHLRDKADTTGNSICVIKKNDIIQVYELLSNGWMKVKTSSGEIGYTSNRNNAYYDYKAKEEENSYKAVVTGGKLNVRKGPGTSYGVKKVIESGTKVTVYEEKNNFGCIDKNEGLWCSLKYLEKK